MIELVRYDLNTHQNETITISKKELKKVKKRAPKSLTATGLSDVRQLDYSVKNTGLYRLQKVVDGSKLEVQRRMSDALVVQCPSASIQFAEQVKCKGDLSDFYLLVQGTAPFKVKYSKIVNQEDRGHVVLSIHSENPMSPLVQQDNMSKRIASTSLVTNISWARHQSIRVSLNESLGIDGVWQYFIDEVYDALGNSMNYSRVCDSKVMQECRGNSYQEQRFRVHERPKIAIDGYNSQNPLMAPKGKSASLPFRIDLKGSQSFEAHSLTVSYLFTPMTDLLPNQEHSKKATLNKLSLRSSGSIDLSEAGLYTVKSINTKYCTGEVLEPSSCMLVNPPQPNLKISAENISDMCAGSSIGLLVDLEMIGTPPFRISYTIRRTGSSETVYHDISRYQDQLKLTPSEAGHYMYEFSTISDDVYKSPRKLIDGKLNLEQDVKPLASAKLLSSSPRSACLEQVVKLDIIFSGVAPWNLEYEVLHNGHRQKYNVGTIHENQYELSTDKLMEGGDYFVILNSISDKSRCKVLLEQEAKIEVSLQKPKASFGHLGGKREISALEGKMTSLPVRLQGTAPWTVEYRNLNEVRDMSNETKTTKVTLFSKNDQIEASVNGVYEIVSINDANCPGVIELSTNKFEVRWIPKPVMTIAKSSFLEYNGQKYIKKDVCEDDEDSIDLFFTGTAPYTVQYNENFISSLGSPSRKHQRRLVSGLNSASFKMDTSKAGQYEYEFSRLGDSLYSQAAREQAFLTIRQHVHSKPSARFTDNGKTYKYCKEDNEDDEIIPINLTGIPPFRLEIEIRHHTAAKLEVVHIPHIEATQYSFHMPHRVLALGTHIVTIRKVEDFQGCYQKLEVDAPHVQVSVADIPSISPLEAHTDYCVGDRISFTLSGVPPFNIFYKFQDLDRKAAISTTTFRRIAEKPGEFKIIGISDQRSTDTCKARLEITRIIHEMPSVRVSKGRIASVDLHEGGETEILFEFGGIPPFEFT